MALTNEINILVNAEVKKALDNINKIPTATGKATKSVSKSLGSMKGKFIAMGAGIFATVKAFGGLLKVTGDFEQAIANVASVSGGATEELSKLARQAGKETVFSATEAANALYFLASAGIATEDMADVLTPVLNLAAAAQIGLAEATDLVVNQLKIYGKEMTSATEFSDIMAKTVASSNTNMQQLGEGLSYSASIANQVGVPFKKLNALLGLMGDRGIKATRAGTQVRQMFARLVKPTAGAQKILAKYGITQDQVTESLKDPVKLFKLLEPAVQNSAEATEIFGVRQQDVIGIIKTGIQPLETLTEKIDDAGGAAKKMADVQIDTLQGSLKLLKSAFQELILSVGGEGGVGDTFKAIIDVLIKVVRGFSKLPTWIKTSTIAIGALLPVVIALVTVLNPVGAIIAGVGAAIGLLVGGTAYLTKEEIKLATVTKNLNKQNEEYEEIVEKLNKKTSDLSKNEIALLKNRKRLLELKMSEEFISLGKALKTQNEETQKNVKILNRWRLEGKKVNALEDKSVKLKKLVNQLNKGNIEQSRSAARQLSIIYKKEFEYTISANKILKTKSVITKDILGALKNTEKRRQKLVNKAGELNKIEQNNVQAAIDYDNAVRLAVNLVKSGFKSWKEIENIMPNVVAEAKIITKEEKLALEAKQKAAKLAKEQGDNTGKTAEAVEKTRKSYEGLTAAISVFDSQLGSNIGNIGKAKDEMSKMNTTNSTATQRFAGMATVVGAVISLIAEIGGKLKNAGKDMQDFASVVEGKSKSASNALTGMGRVLEGFGGFIEAGKEGIGGFIKFFKGHYDERIKIIEDFQNEATKMQEDYLADQEKRRLENELKNNLAEVDAKLKATIDKLDIDHEYSKLLAKEEEERYNNLSVEEKRKFDLQQDYENQVADAKEKAEAEKLAIQKEYDRKAFENSKTLMEAQAEISKQSALAEAEGILGASRRRKAKNRINSSYDDIISTIQGLSFYKDGGRNIEGGLSVVGEQGAELVNLPKGTDIYNNSESKQITRQNNQSFAGANFDMTGVKDKEMFMQWMLDFAEDRGVAL